MLLTAYRTCESLRLIPIIPLVLVNHCLDNKLSPLDLARSWWISLFAYKTSLTLTKDMAMCVAGITVIPVCVEDSIYVHGVSPNSDITSKIQNSVHRLRTSR